MPIKEQYGSPTYHVGDTVIVAAKPYTYGYSISIDGGNYAWCANCFTRAEPDADFEISSEDYANILTLN